MADPTTTAPKPKPEHERLLARWSALKQERSPWDARWREVSDYLLPFSGRFFQTDRNKPKAFNSIYDSTGTRALRILAAGMMSGMTSPARPWFRLTTSDPQLDESAPVKQWLSQVGRLMLMVFAKSNTYRALHSMYEELGAFGTASAVIADDFENVVHCHTMTAGQYAVATDFRGQVCTLYREFEMSAGQMVKEFGRDKVSDTVRGAYDRGSLDMWVPVVHTIEPRADRDPTKRDSKNMAWASYYFEPAQTRGQCLRESGFRRFRAVAPRWATTGGDIYGSSPGMEALGDVKQLQHEQLRKAQGIDYMTKPPLQLPTSMKNQEVDTLPGGSSYVDMTTPNGGIKTAFEVNLNLQHLLSDIVDVRERVKGCFYADLFLMLQGQSVSNMTATEVAERHEEKLLMLGPVLERLHNELLDPLIEITFERMLEAGIVPPPPQELQGMQLNVEFVSMLAQAQRAVATNSVDRFVGSLGAIAGFRPDVLDKFDADHWADSYADMLGVDPELIVPSDRVALIRKGRADAAAAQQRMQTMDQAATIQKNLSQARTDQPSALQDVTKQFAGYT